MAKKKIGKKITDAKARVQKTRAAFIRATKAYENWLKKEQQNLLKGKNR